MQGVRTFPDIQAPQKGGEAPHSRITSEALLLSTWFKKNGPELPGCASTGTSKTLPAAHCTEVSHAMDKRQQKR